MRIDAAFRKLAHEVRIPASGPGRRRGACSRPASAPRSARDQALQDSLPEYYAEAVVAENIDVDRAAGDRDHRGRGRRRRRVRRRRRGAARRSPSRATTSCTVEIPWHRRRATRTIDTPGRPAARALRRPRGLRRRRSPTATTPTIDIKGFDRRRSGRGPHRHRLPLRGRFRDASCRRSTSELRGKRPGDILKFTDSCPSASASAPAKRSRSGCS